LQVWVAGAWQVCVVVLLTQVWLFDLQVCAVPLHDCVPPVQVPATKPTQVWGCSPVHVCVCDGPPCGQLVAVASHHSTLSFSK
jgi:hypothetical protein